MLTRLYVDNFRCFVNFEYRPDRKQLILGTNGAGKSSLLDVLLLIKRIALGGVPLDQAPLKYLKTRWVARTTQHFEIDALIDGQAFQYKLRIDLASAEDQYTVVHESLLLNQHPLVEFSDGSVTLAGSGSIESVTYPFEPTRSCLASTPGQFPYASIGRFRRWLQELQVFRINPFAMLAASEREERGLRPDLSNFASWYRSVLLSAPKQHAKFLADLREVFGGFDVLRMPEYREDNRTLIAEFSAADQSAVGYSFTELSEGQRCLIGLYAVLHFFTNPDFTLIIDEPDNFISLREIQPWLSSLAEVAEEKKGQAVLISHHPELINQWAPSYGVEFIREDGGPVRVRRFQGDAESPLSPAELIARGWHNG